ncbi:hypothetical protein [Methanogenium organophilum]|uniref:Uncharacterized protein n=1 Tax=Methanogenium organophilum TaxID=2199 RepID=A0A9X9T7F1_METOG|nr:hypothetical protein [Methanogenium organophilum]WAI01298.1 hypothetical protein OU421_12960 [Methanogenium organophilum]
MLKKAGYVQTRRRMIRDCDNQENNIIEVIIHGTKFGIRLSELYQAMSGIRSGRIEPIRNNAECRLCGTAGKVFASSSGKAVNITLNNGDRFTVSQRSLRHVLAQCGRYAPLYSVPRTVPVDMQTVFSGDTDYGNVSVIC